MGTACFHSVISCLGLLWDSKAETYCWPNVTRRSLLSTAASGARHSLETLQTLFTRHRYNSSYFLTFLFFFSRLMTPYSSRSTSSLSLEDSSKGIVALRFMSGPCPAMSPMLRVYRVWVIFTSFPITVSTTVKPAKLNFANKQQCVFYPTDFRSFIIYSDLEIAQRKTLFFNLLIPCCCFLLPLRPVFASNTLQQ